MKGRGIVVVGAQFGDEGKGKIVDELAGTADVVARFQGGSNAGHTVVVDGRKHKLHLLPTGVVRSRRSLICAGVVVNPLKLLAEISDVAAQGIAVSEKILGIDFRSQVIMPWHLEAELASSSAKAIGTTFQGIGPAYSDAASRSGITFSEFLDGKTLAEKFAGRAEKMLVEAATGQEQVVAANFLKEYSDAAQKLEPFACDASAEVNEALRQGKRVLFEGAQGTMLDNTFGTYPFVTSSHTIAGGACVGAGVAPSALNEVHGVAKAYTTRVGAGPFPTELADELGERLVEKGGEYGTTTGRKRRVGWLDACMLRRSHELNGYTDLHLTKLDVLGGISSLKIAVSYLLLGGRRAKTTPAQTAALEQAVPEYLEMSGFEQLSENDWELIAAEGKQRGLQALPKHALEYALKVQELVGVRISSVSVGPGRGQIIWAIK